MNKELVTLSDWIHFLGSIITFCNTIIFGVLSIIVILTVSLYLFTDWAQMILLLVLSIIIIVILWFIYGKGNVYKKSIFFLREIMKGTKNNPEIIRKEWFEKREKKMFKDISVIAWKEIRVVALTSGIGILAIGLFLMKFGTAFYPIIYGQWITSFGLAILALGVAFHSIVLSKETDRRFKDVANANFLRVLSIFEDRRIDLQYHTERIRIHPILIWKALVDMQEADELLEFCDIDLPNQSRLIHLLNHLIKYTKRAYTYMVNCEEVSHILSMTLLGLKVDEQFTDTKDAVRGGIRSLLDEPQGVEINEDYIKGIKGCIPEDIFRFNFILYRDQIKEWYYSM